MHTRPSAKNNKNNITATIDSNMTDRMRSSSVKGGSFENGVVGTDRYLVSFSMYPRVHPRGMFSI